MTEVSHKCLQDFSVIQKLPSWHQRSLKIVQTIINIESLQRSAMYRVALFMAALKKMDNEQNFAIVAKNRFLLFAKMSLVGVCNKKVYVVYNLQKGVEKSAYILTYNTTCPTFQLYLKIYLGIQNYYGFRGNFEYFLNGGVQR